MVQVDREADADHGVEGGHDVVDVDGLVVIALRGCRRSATQRTDGNNKNSRNDDANCTWNVATADAQGGPHMREPYSMMKGTTTTDGKGRGCSEAT